MTSFCEALETHGRRLDGDSLLASMPVSYQVIRVRDGSRRRLAGPFKTRLEAQGWLQGMAESFAPVAHGETWDWARLQHGPFLRVEAIGL